MSRYLRRRIAEEELNNCTINLHSTLNFNNNGRLSDEMQSIIEFLQRVLSIINDFIEKANAFDVTLGPRIFLQCPLSITASKEWFIELWNEKIVPYMGKVARDSMFLIFL